MATVPITIHVDEGTAKAFAAASEENKRKMELLVTLRLQDLMAGPQRALKDVMDEIGKQAEASGMTPAILESLLHGERTPGSG
jgi:ferritin-like protein